MATGSSFHLEADLVNYYHPIVTYTNMSGDHPDGDCL
jgi:hypothetical protein